MESKFLVFAGDDYYPAGGWYDQRGFFDSIEEARKNVPKNEDWYQIVDLNTLEIVEER